MALDDSQVRMSLSSFRTSDAPSSPEYTAGSRARTVSRTRFGVMDQELLPDEPWSEELMPDTAADWRSLMEEFERWKGTEHSAERRLADGRADMTMKGLCCVRNDLVGGFRKAKSKHDELRRVVEKLREDVEKVRAEGKQNAEDLVDLRAQLSKEVQRLREEFNTEIRAVKMDAAAHERKLSAVEQDQARVKQDVRSLQDHVDVEFQRVHARVEQEAQECKAGNERLGARFKGLAEELRLVQASTENTAEAIRKLAAEHAAQVQAFEVKLGHISSEVVRIGSIHDWEAIQRRVREIQEEVNARFTEQRQHVADENLRLGQRVADLAGKVADVADERVRGDQRLEHLIASMAQKEDVDAAFERCRFALTGLIDREAETRDRAMKALEHGLWERMQKDLICRVDHLALQIQAQAEARERALKALEHGLWERLQKDCIGRVEHLAQQIQAQVTWRATTERMLQDLRRDLNDLVYRVPTRLELQELERKVNLFSQEISYKLEEFKEQHQRDLAIERAVMEDSVTAVEEKHWAMVNTYLQEIGRKLMDMPRDMPMRHSIGSGKRSHSASIVTRAVWDEVTRSSAPPLPAPAVPPPPITTLLPQRLVQQDAVHIAMVARSARSVVSARGTAPAAPSPAALGPRRLEQAVMISGHVARRAANGVYWPLRRTYMGAPVYFCKQANAYLFSAARSGSWGIGDKPTGALLALVQDSARVAGEIRGTWKVQGGGGITSWVEDPRIVLTPYNDQERIGDAVAVSSHTGSFVGGYQKTQDQLNGAPIYFNRDARKNMWFNLREWVISDHPGSGSVHARSHEVSDSLSPPRPDAVAWKGAEVQPVEASDSDPDEDDMEFVGGSFIDEEFPPEDANIGAVGFRAEWVRAAHLCTANPRLFSRQDPGPLMSGAQGDCWLLSAIAAVAEFPGYLYHHVLRSQSMSASGHYRVTLYDFGVRGWVDLVVDDLIPCKPKQWYERRAKPIFSQPYRNEMHVLIIEKAFAKFAGSYQALAGGVEILAWVALLGEERQFCWDCRDGTWVKTVLALDRYRMQSRSFRLVMPFEETDERKTPRHMFEYLEDCIRRNYLVGAVIPASSHRESRRDGLVDTYTYPLLDCKEVEGHSLVQLRNPWGPGQQWEGNWGPTSALWRERPAVERALGFQANQRDAFWMEWQDFVTIFQKIYVSPKDMPYPRAARAILHADPSLLG